MWVEEDSAIGQYFISVGDSIIDDGADAELPLPLPLPQQLILSLPQPLILSIFLQSSVGVDVDAEYLRDVFGDGDVLVELERDDWLEVLRREGGGKL